jgi:hypothetical protein
MVAKRDILTAAQRIKEALEGLVQNGASTKVFVFETEWGHLRALVGSDGFRGMSLGRRRDVVWNHLRAHVPPDLLANLVAVHPFDLGEYDANVSQAGFLSGQSGLLKSTSEECEEHDA